MWLFFALATALYIHRDAFNPQAEAHTVTPITFWQTGKRWAVTFFIGLANWVLFSAAAIAVINLNPYLSLALALLGGGDGLHGRAKVGHVQAPAQPFGLGAGLLGGVVRLDRPEQLGVGYAGEAVVASRRRRSPAATGRIWRCARTWDSQKRE